MISIILQCAIMIYHIYLQDIIYIYLFFCYICTASVDFVIAGSASVVVGSNMLLARLDCSAFLTFVGFALIFLRSFGSQLACKIFA